MLGFLRLDELADVVHGLSPRWDNVFHLRDYLELFDEAGTLRPLFRVLLPPEYAIYRQSNAFMDPKAGDFPEHAAEHFAAVEEALGAFRPDAEHFEPETPWLGPAEILKPYIRSTTAEEHVDWSKWKTEIARDERDRPITAPHVLSYYGDWQNLRFWVLLEGYTYMALLDARHARPEDIGRLDWDNNLNGKVRCWTVGDVRMLGIVDELEPGGWLTELYRTRRVLQWGGQLYQSPQVLGWTEGVALDPQVRWEMAIAKVRAATTPEKSAWKGDLTEFARRVRRLIELWEHATARQAIALASAVESDLRGASLWAELIFGLSLDQLDARVGREHPRQRTLSHVLRPTWRQARDVAERLLPQFVASFNVSMKPVHLERQDIAAFLDFLDSQELAVWHLEFAELVGRAPLDTQLDHRFIHLRSMALLLQPVVAALAGVLGTRADLKRVEAGSTKWPMGAFLADRSDWRHDLWELVSQCWCLTQTTDQVRLEDRLQVIDSLSFTEPFGGAVKTLIGLAALRNFGGHRFSNDPGLLNRYWPQLQASGILCPLFYWKIARDLR